MFNKKAFKVDSVNSDSRAGKICSSSSKKTSFSAAGKAVLRALYIGLLGALLEKLFEIRYFEVLLNRFL